MSPPAAAIRVRSLRKSYGDREALRGVDFDVRPGEVFGLLGPNGAGKTTTVEILEGYRHRDAGEVRVLGHDPARRDRALLEKVGIVLQSCLRRTLEDVAALAELRPSVRLCKGIYVEPPEIAYQSSDEIRESFVRVLDALLAAACYPAVATHDEWLLERVLERVEGMPRDAYELQMLLGVRERRASELVAAGHRLRVYVPYGDRWYEYSLRRLQENPSLATMMAKATVGRLVPRRG